MVLSDCTSSFTFSETVKNRSKLLMTIYLFSQSILVYRKLCRRYPRGVMVKAMDCGIVVSEFVLQSRYYVHFRANTLEKSMNTLILPAMG